MEQKCCANCLLGILLGPLWLLKHAWTSAVGIFACFGTNSCKDNVSCSAVRATTCAYSLPLLYQLIGTLLLAYTSTDRDPAINMGNQVPAKEKTKVFHLVL